MNPLHTPMTKVNALEPVHQAMHGLRAVPLFADLPDEALARLADGCVLREFGCGEYLFREGDPAGHYYWVVQGQVEVLRHGIDGEDRVFSVFGRGHLVAIAAMFMEHGRYPMNARGQDTALCLRLERDPLSAACLSHPGLALRMLRMMGAAVYQRVNEVEWLTASSAPQRLALYLLRLSDQQGRTLQLPLSQRQLASRLGVRAETLNRLLSDWQARGYVAGRGREWAINNRCYLQQLTHGAVRAF